MKFIKLTIPEGNVMHINVDHITSFAATKRGTAIIFSNDMAQDFKETPEEILELIENAEKSKTPYPQSISVEIPERFGR